MRLRSRILSVVLILAAVAVVSLALAVSHDSPCGPAPVLPAKTQLMKAIVYGCYGSPDVLRFEDIEKPTPADDQLLVKVHAASVNPLDWHYMRGTPYLVRTDSGFGKPEDPRLGVDFAGTVEAVGKNVKRFKPGDEVFGARDGAFAEYVTVREERAVVLKPANVTFEQAASVPIAGIIVMIGSTTTGNWFAFLATPVEALMLSPFMSQKFGMILAELNKDDLAALGTLMQSGKVIPVIDRRYRLSETPEALRYLEQGHARGKVVISVE